MKIRNILFALLACAALGGCKGNAIIISSSESESEHVEPTAKIITGKPGALMYKDVTYYEGFYYEDFEGSIIDDAPATATSSDENVVTVAVEGDKMKIYSVDSGDATITLYCETYHCSLEYSVHVDGYGFREILVANTPSQIYVGQSYTLQVSTFAPEHMQHITPPMLYDEEGICECTSYNFTIKGITAGHTVVHLYMTIMQDGHIGPFGASYEFELDVVN